MSHRRLVGIAVGITSAHTVRILERRREHDRQAQGMTDRGEPERRGDDGPGRARRQEPGWRW